MVTEAGARGDAVSRGKRASVLVHQLEWEAVPPIVFLDRLQHQTVVHTSDIPAPQVAR